MKKNILIIGLTGILGTFVALSSWVLIMKLSSMY